MAITSSTQAVTAASYSQLRVQQAQSNAVRAEHEARALQISARAAQTSADRAQEGARNLQIQADQAGDNASRARSGVIAMKSVAESLVDLGARAGRAAEFVRVRDAVPASNLSAAASTVAAPLPVSKNPVVNTEGQTTGALISVTA